MDEMGMEKNKKGGGRGERIRGRKEGEGGEIKGGGMVRGG